VFAHIAGVIEAVGLQIRAGRPDFGKRRFARISAVMSSTAQSAISWMKLMFLYSPDMTREITSRRVISGSTMASRPRRP
jgi:hypothetical protein